MRRLSPKFVRFRDLDEDNTNVEYQVHTQQTDGQASVKEILDIAKARNLSEIAFTEHVRRDTNWFEDFAREVKTEAQEYPDLRVYVGCEAKALDTYGALDATEEIISACDLVLGVVHRFPDGHGGLLDFAALDPVTFARIECELSIGLLTMAPIDVLAHPAGMFQRRIGPYPKHLFREILETSLKREIAVEINSSYLSDFQGFLDLCWEINPYISIGSDAHKLEEVGKCRDKLLASGVPR